MAAAISYGVLLAPGRRGDRGREDGLRLYLAYFTDFNVVYGSLGAVIGFLFLVYLTASIFLFGAELAAAWPRAFRRLLRVDDDLSGLSDELERAAQNFVVGSRLLLGRGETIVHDLTNVGTTVLRCTTVELLDAG